MERREALITGIVLAVACALITVVVVFRADTDADTALVVGSAPSLDSTPEPDTDDGGAQEPGGNVDLEVFVVEAMAFVETTRGGLFVTDPDVVVLDDAAFVARVDADFADDFDSDPELVTTLNAIYRATGLIDSGDSVDEIYRLFGAAGVLGFYDPATDELVVRQAAELSLLTKSTIVHELTHAFDDQLFDLDRPEYEDRTDEVPWTFRAVAEGSASWVEAEWEALLSDDDLRALLNEELNFGDASLFARFERSFLLFELSPYEYGEPFVAHLVEEGGVAALDDALVEPPVTSEQVILPSRFDEGEFGLQIDPPPAEGEVVYEGAGGNALIAALFAGNGVIREIQWGGDQMSVWIDGELSCLRWDLQSENPGGLAELRTGFEEWGGRVGSTSVTSLDDVTIRVDRCA